MDVMLHGTVQIPFPVQVVDWTSQNLHNLLTFIILRAEKMGRECEKQDGRQWVFLKVQSTEYETDNQL